MKTLKDAERVVELSQKRERLHKAAAAIREAETIGAYADIKLGKFGTERRIEKLAFVHLTSDLRGLIKREVERQIATIDDELKGLGVMPDKLEENDIPFE